MTLLLRLANYFLPLTAISYAAYSGATWAGNLFTGWAIILCLAALFKLAVVCYRIGEGQIQKLHEARQPRTWGKTLGDLTSGAELTIAVALGWWFTATVFGVAWGGMRLAGFGAREVVKEADEDSGDV